MTLRIACLSAAAAAMMLAAAPASAQVEAGALNCRSPGAVGLIVTAVLNFDCVFVPTAGPPQHYVATVRRIGVDLGFTQNIAMSWAVFAPTGGIRPGDLAGSYAGVQAGATFGVGLGANALIGGSNNSFALQPVSAQAQSGLNVSAGLAGLELRPAGPVGPGVRRVAFRGRPFRGHHMRHRHMHV